MITEPTTADAEADAREVIGAWTDSLLRLRARPVKVPPRGEWRFASRAEWDSRADRALARPRFCTAALESKATPPDAR